MIEAVRPRVIAHRGSSLRFRENTIEAFVAARDAGAEGIELDVRRCADDVLVVHHDAHLEDGRMIRNLIAAELPGYVPTLAEALEAVDDLWVNIELKNLPADPDYDAENGISLAVAALIAAYEVHDRVLVSSFDMSSIRRIRDLDPSIPLGWIVWGQGIDPSALIARVEASGFEAINPHDSLVDAGFVRRAHTAGLTVNVWTVDDPDRMRSLAELGVDSIMTNDPDAAIAALRG